MFLSLPNDVIVVIASHCEDLRQYARLRATCAKFRRALPDKAFVVRWIHENCKMLSCGCPNPKMFQCGEEDRDDFCWDDPFIQCLKCVDAEFSPDRPAEFLFALNLFQYQRYDVYLKGEWYDDHYVKGPYPFNWKLVTSTTDFKIPPAELFDDDHEQLCCCILWWLIHEKKADVNVVREFIQVLKEDFTFSVAWVLIELCSHELGPSHLLDFLHEQADILKPSKPKAVKFYKKPKKIRRVAQDDRDEEWIEQ